MISPLMVGSAVGPYQWAVTSSEQCHMAKRQRLSLLVCRLRPHARSGAIQQVVVVLVLAICGTNGHNKSNTVRSIQSGMEVRPGEVGPGIVTILIVGQSRAGAVQTCLKVPPPRKRLPNPLSCRYIQQSKCARWTHFDLRFTTRLRFNWIPEVPLGHLTRNSSHR